MSASRVLVTAASRHESTMEIASAIGVELARAGLEVQVHPVDEVRDLDGADAVVLGSGVYMGRWLPPALEFAARNRDALRARPLWLFSSGPTGAPPTPAEDDTADLSELTDDLGARAHRIFPGRLDRRRLGFGERAVVGVVRARDGDFRPWPEIVAWADGIAASLAERAGGDLKDHGGVR